MATLKRTIDTRSKVKVEQKGRELLNSAYPSRTINSVTGFLDCIKVMDKLCRHYNINQVAFRALLRVTSHWLANKRGITSTQIMLDIYGDRSASTMRALRMILVRLREKGLIEVLGRKDGKWLLYVPTARFEKELAQIGGYLGL